MVPRTKMEQELKGQEKELTDDINNLNKKVCPTDTCSVLPYFYIIQSKYLEKQFNDAQSQLRDIVCPSLDSTAFLTSIVDLLSVSSCPKTAIIFIYYWSPGSS